MPVMTLNPSDLAVCSASAIISAAPLITATIATAVANSSSPRLLFYPPLPSLHGRFLLRRFLSSVPTAQILHAFIYPVVHYLDD